MNLHCNKEFSHRIKANEVAVRHARAREQMQTEQYRYCSMEISEKEMKHNNNEKHQQVATFCCSHLKQLCVSFEKELNSHPVLYNDSFNVKTLLINFGVDKCRNGFMYSLPLCTREKYNNSAKRRRLIASAKAPAIESSHNLNVLLEPIKPELKLLKDNASILKIKSECGYSCAIITCDIQYKYQLDNEWSLRNKILTTTSPSTMKKQRYINVKRIGIWYSVISARYIFSMRTLKILEVYFS